MKVDKMYPLLLTGTIDSSVYNNVGNKITDIKDRLTQYEISIEKYIKFSPFNPVVFIDNSGYEFDEHKFERIANLYGKYFEFIRGTVCIEEITSKGKSYGDAFLIHEGLEKSKLLSDYDYFYKITGRIFLKNANKIVRTSDKYRNEFICYTGMEWCLTNIFKCNRSDYLRELDTVYLDCDETKKKDIEICFYKRLREAKMSIGSFEVYPYFEGIQGATLRNYSGRGIERFVRNTCAKIHMFQLDSVSSKAILGVIKFKQMKK